ncbi:MAG: AAA family ATPase [Clostridia bacterium]|nr:AAA family ATPase [Clostridia bacterium]
MKIKSVTLTSFGKFKNFSLDFSEAHNIIYSKNEGGKSTIMAFILLMLYGDLKKDIRNKYLPLDGSPMSGAMEIQVGETPYLIEKNFRKSFKTDKTTLTDLSTGSVVSLAPNEEIGKHFFGIDAMGFLKSAYAGKLGGFQGEEAGADLMEKLSNIISSGDEGISGAQVLKNLVSAKEKLISKSEKKGLIPELKAELENLINQRQEIINISASQQELSSNLEQDKKNYESCQEKIKELNEQLEKSGLIKRGKAIGEIIEKEKELLSIKNAVVTDSFDIDELKNLVAEGKEIKNKLSVSVFEKPDVPEKTITDEEYKHLKSSLDKESRFLLIKSRLEEIIELTPKRNRFSLSLFLSGVFVSLIFLVAGIFLKPMLFGVIAGILLIISSYPKKTDDRLYLAKISSLAEFGISADKNTDFTRLLSEYSSDLTKICADIKEKLNDFGCETEDGLENLYRNSILYSDKLKSYNEQTEKYNLLCEKYISLVNSYVPVQNIESAENVILRTEENLKKYDQLSSNLTALRKAFEISLSLEELIFEKKKIAEITDGLSFDVEAVNEEIRRLSERALSLHNEIEEKSRRLIVPENSEASLSHRICEIENELARETAYYNALKTAEEVFNSSLDEINSTFGDKLNRKTCEIFEKFTGEPVKNIIVSKDFGLKIDFGGIKGIIPYTNLSAGTLDQAYLSLRLAIGELIGGEFALPLVLDDIFLQYDDVRQATAFTFLKDYAKARQILFFTCHKNTVSVAEKGLETIEKLQF